MVKTIFNGNISFDSLSAIIDHKSINFSSLYKEIPAINSNNNKKSDFNHFISVLFGKTSEIFIYQNLRNYLSNSNIQGLRYYLSPKDSSGYEIADLLIFDGIQNKNYLIEIRSSFQKNIHDNLNHIIRYFNQYKKIEYYKDFYFQVFFQENKTVIDNKMISFYKLFNEFNKDNKNYNFRDFLKINNFNSKEIICPISANSFLTFDYINQNPELINKKSLQQNNTEFEAVLIKNSLDISFINQYFTSNYYKNINKLKRMF